MLTEPVLVESMQLTEIDLREGERALPTEIPGIRPNADLIDICDAKDPQLSNCFLRASNQILPFLMKGNEDVGIPSLDPLHISRMDFNQNMGPFSLQLHLYDTVQTGLNTLVFESAKADLKQGVFHLNGTIHYYDVKGRYAGKGRILFIPIGEGKAEFMFNNTKIYIRLHVEPVSREDTVYLRVKKFNVGYDYDIVNVSLSSLFSDNKRLAEAANRFLRSNAKELVHGIQGTLSDSYSRIFSGVVQKFFDHVPLKELFTNLSIPLDK